jgi:hypothetical protein
MRPRSLIERMKQPEGIAANQADGGLNLQSETKH